MKDKLNDFPFGFPRVGVCEGWEDWHPKTAAFFHLGDEYFLDEAVLVEDVGQEWDESLSEACAGLDIKKFDNLFYVFFHFSFIPPQNQNGLDDREIFF